MISKCIIKNDDRIYESEISHIDKQEAYITEQEHCLENIIHPKMFKKGYDTIGKSCRLCTSKEINQRRMYGGAVTGTTYILLNADCGNDFINDLMNIIKEAEEKKDLEKMVKLLFEYEKTNKKPRTWDSWQYLHKCYEKDKAFMMSLIVKKVITKYIRNILENIDFAELTELKFRKMVGEDMHKILLELDPNFDQKSIENGVFNLTAKMLEEEIERAVNKKQVCLCWTCTNGFPSKCQKISDIDKKHIGDYKYITSGYQNVIDEKIEDFMVTTCENYEEEQAPGLSPSEFRRANNDLTKTYYGTNTVTEAKEEAEKRLAKMR